MKSKLTPGFLPALQVDPRDYAGDLNAMLLAAAYQRLPLSVYIAFVCIALFGTLYYQFIFHSQWMLVWIVIAVINYTMVWACYRQYTRRNALAPPDRMWSSILVGQNIITGLTWSFGPVILMGLHFDGGEAAILVVTLLCVAGVSLGLSIGQRWPLVAFLVSALLPTTVQLLYIGGVLAGTLALLLVTSIFVLAAVGFESSSALARLFQAQINLAQSAQEASQAKVLAERSTAIKSQFVANVSHEIRTPMHAILGMLKLLQNADLNKRQADYVNKVEQTAKSLLGLLDDILDFSKIEAERMDLSLHPFRLDRMLHDLSVVLSTNAQKKSVEVLYDVDPDIPKVLLGDAMRLRQVLLNIAGNAVKFTQRGEVVLRIQRVTQSEHDCTLHFSVRDTGIGIAPEHLERIFDEFGQAGGAQRSFGGTGLGLSISKRLVAMMGGEIKVDSVPGVGSTFYFEVTFKALQASTDAMQRGADAGTDLKVLVIDGGDTARELAADMCRSWGWTVETAGSGEAAIVLARTHLEQALRPFDVVVVDWALPGMDGWQAVYALKDLHRSVALPDFLVISGFGPEHLLERPQTDLDHIGGFLPKPFTASMLFDAIVQARSVAKAKPASLPVVTKRVPRLTGIRVLVVEDNLMNQQVVKELLELEGAAVDVVGNGQQAVDLLAGVVARKERAFDAVLMDLQMPNMDGYAATRIIRNELGLHNLPVIAITANMMTADKEASASAGMNAHIGKPFNIDLLVRVIQKEHAVTRT